MKTLKKNAMGIALGLAVLFGSALSFAPNQAQAYFGKIPCWSAGSGTSGTYVKYSTCTDADGQPTGGGGKCKAQQQLMSVIQ